MFKRGIVVILFLWSAVLQAQELPPRGQFLADSLKIGEPVPYTLGYRYDATRDVIFPDSLFNFEPFELDHKEYFPTQTRNGISYDSAVYYLSYFELDTFQIYSLPVFEIINGDSTRLIPQADTIFLKQVVTEVPDSLAVEAMPLIENTDYIQVPFAFNYPYAIIGLIIFVIVMVLVIVFFGKSIRNAWKVFWLKRRHHKFMEKYNRLTQEKSDDFRKQAEKIIIMWKKYLQQLEEFPYTSLTTKELVRDHPDTHLGNALHSIDAAMYNPRETGLDEASFLTLRDYAVNRFERKVKELNND
ncbi:hypothetical protein [Fulvivirga sedimenti]|uniref:Uncharacterized protein n=1 Tax=Fulvivirga sedimenti TaxID=2879465 RepID=A0A9X1HPM1_9BACT|nr:hypothetical protein [Fulvivirga sedimenti]MCA6073882.1 hypothetical protein [Fulvivirga sedimenti]